MPARPRRVAGTYKNAPLRLVSLCLPAALPSSDLPEIFRASYRSAQLPYPDWKAILPQVAADVQFAFWLTLMYTPGLQSRASGRDP